MDESVQFYARKKEHVLIDRGSSVTEIKLSKSQKKILPLIERGLSNEEISIALDISDGTLKAHLWRLYKKLGVKSRTQALAIWRRHCSANSLLMVSKTLRERGAVTLGSGDFVVNKENEKDVLLGLSLALTIVELAECMERRG